MQYQCLKALEQRLSDAVDKAVFLSLIYNNVNKGEQPVRLPLPGLLAEHELDEAFAPLLAEMLGERPEDFDFELDNDEIIMRRGPQAQKQWIHYGAKAVDLVASYENLFGVPYEERLTHYWGDFGDFVRNSGVTDTQLHAVYAKALREIGMDSSAYQDWYYTMRRDVETHMRNCLLGKALWPDDKVLFIPHCPTGPDGQFQYETGCVAEVDPVAQNCVIEVEDGEMTVPLSHVLSRFGEGRSRSDFIYEGAQLLFGMHEIWAQNLLSDTRRAYEEQLALAESEGGLGEMNMIM